VRYPIDRQVTVYVDPANPTMAVPEPANGVAAPL
jgi:hypothetical protein